MKKRKPIVIHNPEKFLNELEDEIQRLKEIQKIQNNGIETVYTQEDLQDTILKGEKELMLKNFTGIINGDTLLMYAKAHNLKNIHLTESGSLEMYYMPNKTISVKNAKSMILLNKCPNAKIDFSESQATLFLYSCDPEIIVKDKSEIEIFYYNSDPKLSQTPDCKVLLVPNYPLPHKIKH